MSQYANQSAANSAVSPASKSVGNKLVINIWKGSSCYWVLKVLVLWAPEQKTLLGFSDICQELIRVWVRTPC